MREQGIHPIVTSCLFAAVPIIVTACGRPTVTVGSDLPVGTAVREIRLGSVDSPDFAFSEVNGLTVGENGDIYSLHRREAVIRRWSATGEAIGMIGQRGQGPGEFISPFNMGWRGDSLWVFDTGTSRLSLFDETGRFERALTPAVDIGSLELAEQGVFPARPVGLLGDGTIHGSTIGGSHDVVEGRFTRVAHVRMTAEGSTIDTVLTTSIGRESVLAITRGRAGLFGPQPFGDGVLSTLTPDGHHFLVLDRTAASRDGASAEFLLRRVALDGDTVLSLAYAYEPVAIPGDTIDARIRERLDRMSEVVGAEAAAAEVRQAMYIPAFYPPVNALVAGRDGTIWMALNPRPASGTEWLVVDPNGDPIGKVILPTEMEPMAAERSMVWGTERGEFDIEYIVRYRIEFAGAE
jgi:hypothetical protein